jgi:hypothetical protein
MQMMYFQLILLLLLRKQSTERTFSGVYSHDELVADLLVTQQELIGKPGELL